MEVISEQPVNTGEQTVSSDVSDMPDPTASLAPEQVVDMKRAFAVFDKDNDGTIAHEELRLVLRSMGTVVPDKVLERMFNEIDIDGNGVIDISEFITLMKAWSRFVIALRKRLGGFRLHCVSCIIVCVTINAAGILLWSNVGWGADCLNGLEDMGKGWLPTIALCIACCILFLLYLLDFFIPPHIPRKWLTLSARDPGVGMCIFATALAFLFCGNLPLAVQDNPHRPLMMTLYLAPAAVVFLGFRVKFYHKKLQMSMKKNLQKDGTSLEIELFYVVKDIAMQDDDSAFFKAAMVSFVVAGSLCLLTWIPWVIFNEVPDPSSEAAQIQFVLWVAPVMLALAMFIFAGMLLVRVQAHETYTSVSGPMKRSDSYLSKVKGQMQRALTRSYSIRSIDKGVVGDIGVAERRQLRKIAVLKNALKIMTAVCLCVFGMLLVFSGLAFPDSPISNMIRDYLISFTLSFVIFVMLAFSRLIAEIHEGVKDMPTWKSLLRLLTSDWFRAFIISCCGPFIFVFLLLSATNQQIRRVRGLKSIRERESMNENNKGQVSEYNYAQSWAGCFTERIRKRVRSALGWDWLSIGVKIHVVCSILIVVFLTPLFFNIVFAYIIDALQQIETWWTVLLVLFVGIVALLCPFVPTTTVYVFGGVTMADKWMSLPSKYGGFWIGVVACIALSLLIKLLGRFLQHQCFGKILGKRLWVQQVCKVHTPIMRTVAIIMAEPGFWRLGKVCVLCGVPDWPMGVGAGILGFPLMQTLLGTVPIVMFIAPCVMLGSFYLRKDENEGWEKAYVAAMLFIGVVNMVFQVLAAHSLQKTFGENVSELSKPCLDHIDLHWLDHCSIELARARHPNWDEVPCLLSWLLALSSIAQIGILQLFFWAWDSCFGLFEVTDSIDTLQWHGDDSVILPIGYMCLGFVAISILACFAMYRWMVNKHHGACMRVMAELQQDKESWMQSWREMVEEGINPAQEQGDEDNGSDAPSLKAHKSIDSPEATPSELETETTGTFFIRADLHEIPPENIQRPLDDPSPRGVTQQPATSRTGSPTPSLREVSSRCEDQTYPSQASTLSEARKCKEVVSPRVTAQ